MVAVFTPGLKSTPSSTYPFHQGKVVLPGLIHDVSVIAGGSLKWNTRFDSISRPGSSAIISTRHGEANGALPITFAPSLRPGNGESFAAKADGSEATRARYIPA